MRTPQACAGLLAVLALAVATRADESWRKKPYTEWNEREVREVLEKSPWAHRENLMLVKPSDQNAPCAAGNVRCFSDDSVSYPTPGPRRRPLSPGDLQSQQDHRAASAMAPKPDGVFGTAMVRWESAQTVREALSRSGMKGEKVATTEQEPAPLPPSEAFIVYVDLRIKVSDVKKVPQSGVFTTAMAQSSFLMVKSTGEKISPLRVRSAPLPEFDDRKELALAAYYIYFPRRKDGKPSLAERETLIRFECPLALQPIRSEFDLRDMRRGRTPDI